MNYYRQAAALGSLEPENQIGVIYMTGRGVPPDHAEAYKWFRNAAERHFADAQNHLGLCYMQGIGVTRSLLLGARFIGTNPTEAIHLAGFCENDRLIETTLGFS
jgi:TPR repeat protein